MKAKLFFVAALFACSFAKSQDHSGNFKVDSKMKRAPYGFLWIENGKLAAKQTEVTVDDYLTFLEDVSKDSSYDYLKKLIPSKESVLFPALDTTMIGVQGDPIVDDNGYERRINWIDEEKFKKQHNYPPAVKNKDVDESYLNPYNMPITGISYEQVQEYVKWCTVKYNSLKNKKEKPPEKIVIFRLPTPEEFESTEKKGIETCVDKDPVKCENTINSLKNCRNDKGCALCNCTGKDTCIYNKKIIEAFGPEALYGVYSFNPNYLGLYNMMGNAAEMTSQKGTAKGGSYLQPAKECLPEAVQQYSKPEKWLGLRLFAEVVDVDGKNVYFDQNGRVVINR